MDDFYAAPENAAIAIKDALRIAVMKVSGAPKDQIESETTDLRKSAFLAQQFEMQQKNEQSTKP